MYAQSEQSDDWQGKREAMKERQEARKAELMLELNLTEEQQEQWNRIEEKHEMQRKAYREAQQKEREAFKEKMKESRKSQMAATEAILTPEQLEKMKTFREERKAEMKERRKDHPKANRRKR